MADLASLGFAIDSSPLQKLTTDLNAVVPAAEKVEQSVGKAAGSVQGSVGRMGGAATATERMTREAERYVQQADRMDRAVRQANGGLSEHQKRSLEAARANDNFSRSADMASKSAGGFGQAIGLAQKALGALGVALSVQQLVSYADGWSDMQSRVGAAVRNMEAAPLLMERIVQIANASYSPLNQTVEVFSRNVSILGEMGYNAGEAADFTEALNNALVLTATRGERAASVQSALAKAMAVGKLEADGLETVLVNGDAVAQALAASLGTTTNGLRAMASEGKITGAVIADSIISNFDDFQARAQEMPATIGDAFVRLGTNLSAFIGQLDQTSGASGRVATTLLAVADSIDFIARAAAVAGVAITGAFAPAILAGIATGLTTIGTAGVAALTAITAAMTANPLGALAVAIATTITALYLFRDEITSVLGVDLIDAARRAANEFIGLFVGAYDGVKSAWSNLPNFMSGVAKEAWNALIAEFEQPLLTANGITLIPGLDLSSLRKQTSEVERMAMENTIVAFSEGFRAEYIPAAEAAVDATRTAEDAAADLNAILGQIPTSTAAAAGGIGTASTATDAAADATKRLADEADRLWSSQNPFEAAVAESQRLLAAVDDLSNGLSETQRAALRFEADEVFRRLTPDAREAAGEVRAIRDEFEDLGKVGGEVIDMIVGSLTGSGNIADNLMNGLGRLSSGFVQAGANRLKSVMGFPTGQGGLTASGYGGFGGFDARSLGALNDNLRQSSRSALDVAKQFDGLNERADSRVLDSFMQASGTWRNLSASDTAWCAAFANAAIVKAGGQGTNSNLASSFMDWGMGTNNPQPGDIVVLKPQARGASGHVTFFDGFDANGNVRGFGGNQGNMARTSTYSADQVRAFRTATRDGYVDAARQIATGQSGNVPSSVAIPSARPVASLGAGASGGGLFGQGGRAQQFMQSPLGMGGMNALSAFGAGASSGSPVSGGFSGALGAFGMGLGPVGIIAGGLAGIVGGLFGRSRQRREQRRQQQEQERQQRLQAQQQLDQQMPAILELQDTLLDRASGTLTKERARIESQIKQYQQLAATAKNQAEIDRLKSMQANLDDYMNRLYDQIRLTADSVVQSMMAGRGLEPEFAKAVSAVREQSLSIRNYLADLTAATGEGSSAVVQATEAGRQQLLRQLSGAEEVTEIWTGLDRLSGTAAQLGTELQKLGMNAEEAAASVRDHLNRGIQRMRDDFVRGVADETAEGMGLGYLPQLRALTDRRNTMRADATSLGADPALIDRWFGVQARNILDQAGLLNDEIAPLVKAFPELAGVLGDSSAKIERTLGEAENDLRTAYQRVRQFADQLASFRGDIALDRNLSILGPQERLLEAQNRFREVSEKAAAGDAVAQGELIGLSRSYLDEARSYYASSEGYFSIFREVDGTLKATEAKVVAELDMATAQHKALLDLNASVLTIPDALRQLNEAMAVRDLAQGQALQAYVQALNPQAAVPSYQQPNVAVTPAAPPPVAAAPAPTAPAMVNRSLWNGQTFSNYVGNFQEYNGRSIFVPSGWTAARAWSLHVQQQQAPRGGANGPTYNAGMRLGGIVGGYQGGGVVGNGIWDVDSVLARYEGGGMIALAKGEGVLNAPAMRQPGVRPFMEAANAGRLPSLPQIAMPSLPRVAGADNRELVAEMQALRREVQALKAVTAQGAMETAGAVREGNATAREQAMAIKRSNAA